MSSKTKLNCFVIIGFGKKTSYATGTPRILDLDETFELLIKPVFEELEINCYRAIDKNITGSIDKLMLQEIKDADFALVDLSTLNANVMWELGVRHALKPNHTLMICEEKQMQQIPFDISSFIIHQYAHSEAGIPYKEVDRFRQHLKKIVVGVTAQENPETDSPVFTFLGDQMKVSESNDLPLSSILKKGEGAKKSGDFDSALTLFQQASAIVSKNPSFKDELAFITSRIALCTYKSKQPNELDALKNAADILKPLNPQNTMDIEVMGLYGAIHKRLFELNNRLEDLETSISIYERGFSLKKDYYNGINTAFTNYSKALILKSKNNDDWEDSKMEGDYFRNNTLKQALKLESEDDFEKSPDAIWVLLTIAEAYHYKNDLKKMEAYENKASEIAEKTDDKFAMSSYNEQKSKIKTLFKTLNN